jgi:Flp pilus assembly protein TadD
MMYRPRDRYPLLFPLPLAALLLFALLSACSSSPATDQLSLLAPLQLPDGQLTPADAELLQTPDLLATNQEMRDFVTRYTADSTTRRQRLVSLHRAVSGSATLGIDYDPMAGGTALGVFYDETANCLSYANLFVALAREAGLDARYQWVEVRPQWTRMGERVAVRLHVNTVVHLSRSDRYMVDIDPLPSRDITGSQEITDTDARALYHNNLAMGALADEQLEQAWLHGARALQLSPELALLWTNMGAIYRRADQHRDAEAAYLHALQLDSDERSAMNNLMVLYELEQREQDSAYWVRRVERHRDGNPYYHAWLGDQAGEEGDWRTALGHYQDALELQPEDANLHFTLAVIYQHLEQPRAALRYVEQAIEHASLASDRRRYRLKLGELQGLVAAAP